MQLTKKSKKKLYNQFNGTGVIFVKTRDKEISIIEFYQDRNGKFRDMAGMELIEAIHELEKEVEEEE